MIHADRLRTSLVRPCLALAAMVLQSGCMFYTLATAPSPTHDIPGQMFGLGLGPTSMEILRRGGWTLADSRESSQTFLLASPDKTITDVEAQVVMRRSGQPVVQYLRLRFAETRYATYKELVAKLVGKYGQPQTSETMAHFDLFEPDPNAGDVPRSPSFVVHRWIGRRADLVLVGGLEDPEVLASYMQYQVLLLPHGAVAGTSAF